MSRRRCMVGIIGDLMAGMGFKRFTFIYQNPFALNAQSIKDEIRHQPQEREFYSQWLFSATGAVNCIIEEFFFDEKSLPFRSHVKKMTWEKFFQVFELLSWHFIIKFLESQYAHAIFTSIQGSPARFEEVMLNLLKFAGASQNILWTSSGKKIYDHLKELYSKDGDSYEKDLYQRLLKIFDISEGESASLGHIALMYERLSLHYTSFSMGIFGQRAAPGA
ncbi:MAG: hypothetical protein RDV48_28295 [Candidatus Eremiobacteraeota bacterium]|nr:hypothetical protein [Candidatus Eremiobacteraeota bacterium]